MAESGALEMEDTLCTVLQGPPRGSRRDAHHPLQSQDTGIQALPPPHSFRILTGERLPHSQTATRAWDFDWERNVRSLTSRHMKCKTEKAG